MKKYVIIGILAVISLFLVVKFGLPAMSNAFYDPNANDTTIEQVTTFDSPIENP